MCKFRIIVSRTRENVPSAPMRKSKPTIFVCGEFAALVGLNSMVMVFFSKSQEASLWLKKSFAVGSFIRAIITCFVIFSRGSVCRHWYLSSSIFLGKATCTYLSLRPIHHRHIHKVALDVPHMNHSGIYWSRVGQNLVEEPRNTGPSNCSNSPL